MEIFGLGIVGACMFIGSFIGRMIGELMGIGGDVGGVGFAMILLIVSTDYLEKRGKGLSDKTKNGIYFLSALYIPVVVAMSSNQNVVVAIESGVVPIAAGVIATVGAIMLVPLISKLSK